MSKSTDKLKTSRGQAYYVLLKTILSDCGQQIAADARTIIYNSGSLTPVDIGALAVKYSLNFKATCEWLEECRVIPTGTYDGLIRRGLKAREVLAAAKGRNKQCHET